jgi:hypothetical protein
VLADLATSALPATAPPTIVLAYLSAPALLAIGLPTAVLAEQSSADPDSLFSFPSVFLSGYPIRLWWQIIFHLNRKKSAMVYQVYDFGRCEVLTRKTAMFSYACRQKGRK